MKRMCSCFTPSRIALAEGALETVSLPPYAFNSFFFFCLEPLSGDYTTFTLHDLTDLYIEDDSAPH